MNTPAHPIQTVTLAFTGASGMPYGMRLLECLLEAGKTVWLLLFAGGASGGAAGNGAEPARFGHRLPSGFVCAI